MVQTLKKADEIWTPSFYSRKAMIESGLDFNKVQVIPNGINPQTFKPSGDKYYLPTNKKLKFLYVGGTIYRKGFDVLLKAFTEIFNRNDDVCLVVKDTGTDSFYEGINSELAISKAKNRYDAPEIVYIKENLTENQMASLYRACDIIVAPYRAESFCLPLLEGIACGLPAIATKGGASDDFLEEAFTRFISANEISIGDKIDGMPLTGNAFMLEPSEDDLKEALLYFYSNPSNIVSMGAIASAYARTKWTWNKSVIKVLRRLDYLYGTKMSKSAEELMKDTYDSSMIFGTAEHSYVEGDYSNATDLYMQAIKGDVPEKYKLLGMHRIAMILINRGEQNAAYDILNSVKDITYSHPDSTYIEVIINASLSKHTEALEKLSPLLDRWKDYKFESSLGHNLDDLLVLTADLLFANNDIDSAHSLYTTALSLNNSNSFACYGAAMCFKISGLDNKAQEMFEWAVKLNPDFEDAQKELDLINQRNY
jgi:tetratricopeptide (TPR) repeat protein